jgi:histidinol-phosphate phosphatase family protein
MTAPPASYSVVVPTVGRPSLVALLDALAAGGGPGPIDVVLVDDRASTDAPLLASGDQRRLPVRVIASGGGRGPAAARNAGWRTTSSPWVVFLDDDVVPTPEWRSDLAADLADLPWQVGGSQGRIHVPLPTHRRPTDWERNTAGLMTARWATADLAYRREVLEELGGFDERFGRAFREDADLGLRVGEAGYLIVQGSRRTDHPVRPAGRSVSVMVQGGNADDVLMAARHGAWWRQAAGAEPGRNGRHLLATTAAGVALTAWAVGRPRTALGAAGWWLATTSSFAISRIRPGPRSPGEIATMAVTSAVIPPAAVAHRVRGRWQRPALLRDAERAPLGRPRSPLALQPTPTWSRSRMRPRSARADIDWNPAAVLFDRDGTLIEDLPANTDPDRVALMPGARAAIRRARSEGLAVAVITNQSAIGRATATVEQVEAINRRVDDLLGPFDTWQICPHTPSDGCGCRKPAPGLVKAAAAALGVDPGRCAVIGDIGSDVEAAAAAGARSVLVPARATRPTEIAAAPVVAANIGQAVDLVLARMC